jgi:hypothetical protein
VSDVFGITSQGCSAICINYYSDGVNPDNASLLAFINSLNGGDYGTPVRSEKILEDGTLQDVTRLFLRSAVAC